MIPYYGTTPYRSIGPTSLAPSQVYRVTFNLATATTPIGDYEDEFMTTTVASIEETTPAGSSQVN